MPTRKKASLSTALKEASGQLTKVVPGASLPPEPGALASVESPTTSRAPIRQGKKIIAGYFDAAVSKQLKQMALDEDTNIQALLREALNDLFTKRGKAPIA